MPSTVVDPQALAAHLELEDRHLIGEVLLDVNHAVGRYEELVRRIKERDAFGAEVGQQLIASTLRGRPDDDAYRQFYHLVYPRGTEPEVGLREAVDSFQSCVSFISQEVALLETSVAILHEVYQTLLEEDNR